MTKPPPECLDAGEVVLRRVLVSDAALIADTVFTNLQWLSRWMAWAVPQAATLDDQHRRLPSAVASWDEGLSFQYLAQHADTGVHLGNFALERRIGPRAIEIGYWLAESATGHGYATAAVRVLARAALDLADVDRVEIHTDQSNVRSALIPQRLGFRLERIEPDEVQTPAESGQGMIWVLDDGS